MAAVGSKTFKPTETESKVKTSGKLAESKKGVQIMSPKEYADVSAEQGKYMGRALDQKTKLTIEELRVLINEGWTREMVRNKHGLTDEELNRVFVSLMRTERKTRADHWR